MNLRAALIATATAAAFLLVPACGGDSPQPESAQSQQHPQTSQLQPDPRSAITAKYVTIDLNCSACSSSSGSGIGDGEQVGSGRISGIPGDHALLWRGSASTVVDLGVFAEAGAVLATSGGVQVGWFGNDKYDHAVKWGESAGSAVDIHPGGVFRESKAFGIAGDQVIGYGLSYGPDTYAHALLWTSRGVVDLNPRGFSGSIGNATDGGQQVGYGAPTGGIGLGAAAYGNHALLWSGTAESVVDLHPVTGYDATSANGVGGGQQVGWGGGFNSIANSTWTHALLWTGTAQSVVDLHPSGFNRTQAQAAMGGQQVGWGVAVDGTTHALLWNGTADSVVDLHAFLPTGFAGSTASGIDRSGNIIGRAVDAHGVGHAILWVRQ
jgi:hypothetical protein